MPVYRPNLCDHTTYSDFTKFSVHVTYGHGLVLLAAVKYVLYSGFSG